MFESKYDVPSSDRPEMVENRRHTQSMRLLESIKSDLDITSFTLKDVQETFNALTQEKPKSTKEVSVAVRFGKSHLDYLVEKGFLSEDEGIYSVNLEKDFEYLEEGPGLLNENEDEEAA